MITPRRTRLVRVPDLHAFRSAIVDLALISDLDRVRSTAVVVPTRGAARQLRRTFENRVLVPGRAVLLPDVITRDQLYDRLEQGLARPVRRLNAFERDAIASAAAREAAADFAPPFRIRPGLVAEVVRFYDQLCRQRQSIDRFEELLTESLDRDTDLDRGAQRMLEQTRFLAATFRAYERRVETVGAFDEHTLRRHVIASPAARPIRRIVVTVGDWIADAHGLYSADFDLLTRLPDLESVDVIATERLLASGFHQRLHDWLPGVEETRGADLRARSSTNRAGVQPGPGAAQASFDFDPTGPELVAPGNDERLAFEYRDREEELVAVARRIKDEKPPAFDRVAVVFKRPLPYLYLARSVFGAARIPYETQDALPLAAEPAAAALDLLLDAAASRFTRAALTALLRSPCFKLSCAQSLSRAAIAAFDRALSDARYLGEADVLRQLSAEWHGGTRPLPAVALPALDAALRAIAALEPLLESRPTSAQFATLRSVFSGFAAPPSDDPSMADRELRARASIVGTLDALALAAIEHDDVDVAVEAVTAEVRRWLEAETFVPESAGSGVQVIDAHAARYGEFDDVTIVGLVEGEWPERPRRNIFYPPGLLATLGWPPEQDRRGAAIATFLDLVGSPARRAMVSTFTLDDEALVGRSILADELDRAGLRVARPASLRAARVFVDEALSLDPPAIDALDETARAWAVLRLGRTPVEDASYHGVAGPQRPRPLSVSAIERYLRCPFQFFAQHVLRLEDEPDDDEVMDPKKQGQFIHGVFEEFFREWQARGHHLIRPADLPVARELFAEIAEIHLQRLPEAEAAIERTRLLGSPVAAGLGDVVFRMESERPIEVVERLLEYQLTGTFTFDGPEGQREVALRGVADRIDLLADGTFRLIDYKLSSAPNKSRALQLPVYGLCAEQRLAGHRGRTWVLGEAAYIAFRGSNGSKRVTPLFTARADRGEVLGSAQRRLVEAVDGIERGEFPPTPEDVFFCTYCSYGAVCRKDYVGDV